MTLSIFFWSNVLFTKRKYQQKKIEANLNEACRAVGLTIDAQVAQLKGIFCSGKQECDGC